MCQCHDPKEIALISRTELFLNRVVLPLEDFVVCTPFSSELVAV